MSPPLVVAFALAGRVDIDLSKEPLGNGQRRPRRLPPRYLAEPCRRSTSCCARRLIRKPTVGSISDFAAQNPMWNEIPTSTGSVYEWDHESTYIQEPPYFENFSNAVGELVQTFTARGRWRFSAIR